MKKLLIKNTKKFILFSQDKNKIHYDAKYAKKFFFKQPILHGINIVLSAFELFLKNKSYNIQIEELEINFKNFCLLKEKLFIKYEKNKIIVASATNEKVEIFYSIKKSKIKNVLQKNKQKNTLILYKLKKIQNLEVINNLVYFSRFIGTIDPGNGSLIHKVVVKNSQIKNAKLKIKKIINNLKNIEVTKSYKTYKILCSKVKEFNNNHLAIKKKYVFKKLLKKKILFFGINSDLGNSVFELIKKTDCTIYSCSFRLDINNLGKSRKIINIITKKVATIRPDFIFYFSSPNIPNQTRSLHLIRKVLKKIYIHYPREILKEILKENLKTKMFLPSTIFLNNIKKNPQIYEYLRSKKEMEKIFKAESYRHNIYLARLPQFKTRSNYNILGFYEGQKINKIKSYICDFINYNYMQ